MDVLHGFSKIYNGHLECKLEPNVNIAVNAIAYAIRFLFYSILGKMKREWMGFKRTEKVEAERKRIKQIGNYDRTTKCTMYFEWNARLFKKVFLGIWLIIIYTNYIANKTMGDVFFCSFDDGNKWKLIMHDLYWFMCLFVFFALSFAWTNWTETQMWKCYFG